MAYQSKFSSEESTRQELDKAGYDLLSFSGKRRVTIRDRRCGHESTINIYSLSQKLKSTAISHGCLECKRLLYDKVHLNASSKDIRDRISKETQSRLDKVMQKKRLILISPYVNISSKAEVECLDCSHRWMPVLHTILYRKTRGCPNCYEMSIQRKKNRKRKKL